MDITVIRSKRKTIGIQISMEGEIIVKAPMQLKDKELKLFVEQHEAWIKKKLSEVEKKQLELDKHSISIGSTIPFLGDYYKISIDSNITEDVILDSDKGFLFKSEQNMEKAIGEWYMREAYNIIPGILECEAKKFKLKYSVVKLSKAAKRFGSCNSKGNINLAWRLIFFPEDAIRYVAIHELAHLKEMNHSQKFWKLVSEMLPQYKIQEQWLKKESYKYIIL